MSIDGCFTASPERLAGIGVFVIFAHSGNSLSKKPPDAVFVFSDVPSKPACGCPSS
jgi:hypothetical protein